MTKLHSLQRRSHSTSRQCSHSHTDKATSQPHAHPRHSPTLSHTSPQQSLTPITYAHHDGPRGDGATSVTPTQAGVTSIEHLSHAGLPSRTATQAIVWKPTIYISITLALSESVMHVAPTGNAGKSGTTRSLRCRRRSLTTASGWWFRSMAGTSAL
ncbi:hypothetical protein E2C01_092061 [Portunus trituberculatus]|uniref:Uncharacterized protein n=1 Tax=Portunus trituberculatus TaxID=210409 RepID=A0A5B7JQR0_PORTR|nr:hypothetical protein [Portunus trituberculatus]